MKRPAPSCSQRLSPICQKADDPNVSAGWIAALPLGRLIRPMIQSFDLDERALVYVQDHLRDLNTFCSALAPRVREEGRAFTVAPVGIPISRLYSFEEGGLLAENRDDTRRVKVEDGWMISVEDLKGVQAEMIADMLRGRPDRTCIIDDFVPEWDDPRREYDLGDTAFGVGKEVYHWFDQRHDAAMIELTLQQAETIWHGVSAVSACSAPAELPTREWLISHARSAMVVFCSAYDGEGFIGWRASQA